jgi:hypothetical protein
MNSYIRETVPTDLYVVAANMRPEDIEEIEAGGREPLVALQQGYDNSAHTYTLVTKDGHQAAILGVRDMDNPAYGLIWMLGTPLIEEYSMTFLKNSRPVLDELLKDYACLYNVTYYKNEVHHKWLRWLGFTLHERQGDWIPFSKWRS